MENNKKKEGDGSAYNKQRESIHTFLKKEEVTFEGYSHILTQITDENGCVLFPVYGLKKVTPEMFDRVKRNLPGCTLEHRVCEIKAANKQSTIQSFITFIKVSFHFITFF